jgi:hypothetical protein
MLRRFKILAGSLAGLLVVAVCVTVASLPAQAAVECGAGHTAPNTLAQSATINLDNDGSNVTVYLNDTVDSVTQAYCGKENAYLAYNHGTLQHNVTWEAYLFYGPDRAHLTVATAIKSASGLNGLYFDAPLSGSVGSVCGMAMFTGVDDGVAVGPFLTAFKCPGA